MSYNENLSYVVFSRFLVCLTPPFCYVLIFFLFFLMLFGC